MKFCGNCGNKVEDNAKFCNSCGEVMDADSKAGDTATVEKNTVEVKKGSADDKKDAEDNKVMGILAYILFLIPLFAGPKDSKFVKYHTNQGCLLFIVIIAWVIIERILSSLFTTLFFRLPYLWGIMSIILWILSLVNFVFLAFAIIGIMNVVNGVKKPLPIIGGIQILK